MAIDNFLNYFVIAGLTIAATFFILGLIDGVRSGDHIAGGKKAKLIFDAYYFAGLGITVASAMLLLYVMAMPREMIQGEIRWLYQSHGRHGESSFYLVSSSGQQMAFWTGDDSILIQNGETAEVTYLRGTHRLCRLRVISGPGAGIVDYREDVIVCFWAGIVSCFGVFVMWRGYQKRRVDPESEVEYHDYRTPITGVDSQSLLQLSRYKNKHSK